MDNWEKFKIVNGAIAAIAIPSVIAFVGNQYSLSIKDREIESKYVELAVNILSESPSENQASVRKWAVDIVNAYSGVKMSPEAEESLVKVTVLPKPAARSLDEITSDILRMEGGFVNHPLDRGGPSKFGITVPVLSKYLGEEATVEDLRSLTPEEARKIYLSAYFYSPGYDSLPESVHAFIVDSARIHGPRRATKLMQQVCIELSEDKDIEVDGLVGSKLVSCINELEKENTAQLINKLVDKRMEFYKRIVANSPEQKVFLKGWIRRLEQFRVK